MKCAAYLAMVLLGGAVGVARAQEAEDVDAGAASPAQVRCADGTTEAVGLDDCAGHGGLATEIGAPMTKSTPATIESQDSTRVAPPVAVTSEPAPAATVVTARGLPAPNPKSELTTTPPAAAVSTGALCHDGTLSPTMRHSPTCLGHAGVREWYGTSL